MGLNNPEREVAYSINDEEFIYDSVDDLLDALDCDGRLEVGTIYYEIDVEPCYPEEFLSAERILEQAEEWAYDELGECAEDMFFGVGPMHDLQQLLNEWAKKHYSGSRYWRCVGKSRERRITEEDLKNVE